MGQPLLKLRVDNKGRCWYPIGPVRVMDGWMLSRKPKVSVLEENYQRSKTFTNTNNYLLNSRKTPALWLTTKQMRYKRGQLEKSVESVSENGRIPWQSGIQFQFPPFRCQHLFKETLVLPPWSVPDPAAQAHLFDSQGPIRPLYS